MNFLVSLGKALLKITQIVAGLNLQLPSPTGGPATPTQTLISDLGAIMQIVVDVEAIGQSLNLTGDQLLAAEIPKVSQLVLDTLNRLNSNIHIQDEALYRDGVANITNGVVQVLKSAHPDGIQTVNKLR